MNHDEIMAQLRDVHLAPPPSWWPPAFGYYLVVGALLVLIAAVFFTRRLCSRMRVKNILLAELSRIEDEFQRTKEVAVLQAEIAALFRRLAFSVDRSLAKNCDVDGVINALAPVLGNEQRMAQIVTLLKEQRFQHNPQVDGVLLVSLAREQIKRCRI